MNEWCTLTKSARSEFYHLILSNFLHNGNVFFPSEYSMCNSLRTLWQEKEYLAFETKPKLITLTYNFKNRKARNTPI